MHQWQVHKLRREEVLLTSWAETNPGCYEVTARWPRGHAFYRPSGGSYDPMLIAESVRQTVPLLSHAVHDVPREFKQAWEDYSFAVEPSASLVTTVEEEVRLAVSCSDVVRRGSRFAGMTMRVDIHLGERLMGTARTRFNNQPAAIYRRLRGSYADTEEALAACLPAGPPVEPHRVGRDSPADVVLSPAPGMAPGRWMLRVDPGHPVLFDHAVDHVPGMLLLEAARQAAHAAVDGASTVTGMRTDFARYVELDAPAVVVAGDPVPDGTGRSRVNVSIEQHGVRVFTSEVNVQRPTGL
ncbi:ScbA/BarX family gamma-butyrolactone biosynthesis protein [Streptomyces sp. CA-278952]|uniref:ScbA/BarX family gamma-butyrolactone biosynthesis protein n=1 Tax=unclassified Streptomyces TaxID=2593676 RepID=UPI002367AE95|nr:ScbA/BarX family gamma-butyrolactone biosynthesis protein [Streptomyces sp. CA-278952]WDG33542.1 ScbA/BarX family gamma-butyrolactone biosynthesis protein [Streptomyces sp. CA-278952]